jgi:hypothetical protein
MVLQTYLAIITVILGDIKCRNSFFTPYLPDFMLTASLPPSYESTQTEMKFLSALSDEIIEGRTLSDLWFLEGQ